MKNITLASRDSLLALAQTIEAALRLEAAGLTPVIASLKTAGDIKLDAPLYDVAAKLPEKEGRAFFTRELDEALLSQKAHAAVHSFKDLPTEPVPGLAEPVFFSEDDGADILLLADAVSFSETGENLIIGTSSLRRIHQIHHVFHEAQTLTLRGNIVTRLMKLCAGDRGINAIIIAAAGLNRLRRFADLPTATYGHLIIPETLEKIKVEIRRFREFMDANISFHKLPQENFPTAPGQGVLAFQLADSRRSSLENIAMSAFPEHKSIEKRVSVERRVMAALGVGCHAPLGVSALPTARSGIFSVNVCYSRESSLNPVVFQNPVFMERITDGDITRIALESDHSFKTAFWWGGGIKKLPAAENMKIIAIDAIKQTLFNHAAASAPASAFTAVFVSSPAVFFWLKKHPEFAALRLWSAGRETELELRAAFPDANCAVNCGERGFSPVLRRMRAEKNTKILWLGSASGEARARKTAAGDHSVDFVSAYDNAPLATSDIIKLYPEIIDAGLFSAAIHLLTSKAAAQTFFNVMRERRMDWPATSCFGESAAEFIFEEGFTPHHISRAETFSEYLTELRGDIRLMNKKRDQ